MLKSVIISHERGSSPEVSVNETHSRAKTSQMMKNTKPSDSLPQQALWYTFT